MGLRLPGFRNALMGRVGPGVGIVKVQKKAKAERLGFAGQGECVFQIVGFRQEGMFQKLTKERDPKAARAELRYSVERLLRGASLVRVSLVTGLQNQIRVQLSALGHPVIGDRKYHPEEASERRITRVALHAAHLEFAHPRSGENVSIDCEPPADFQWPLQRP